MAMSICLTLASCIAKCCAVTENSCILYWHSKLKVQKRKPCYLVLMQSFLDGLNTFPICAACANDAQTTPCTHSTEERAWIGVYTITECNKALTLDYKLLEIYEILHFINTEQYDEDVPGSGLFAPLISDLLKTKIQNSGFPKGIETAEQKDEYKKSIEQHEHIELGEIVDNKPKRSVGKSLLNNFSGKLVIHTTS